MTSTSGLFGIFDMIRVDTGDPDGLIFNDSLLNRIAFKAVVRLNNKLALGPRVRPIGVGGQFGGMRIKMPPIILDVNAGTITPDNAEIIDMVVLQSEIIILKSEIAALRRLNPALGGAFGTSTSTAAQDDISVRNPDGTSVTKGAGRFATRARLFTTDLETLTEELNDAVTRFLARVSSSYSKYIY